MKRSLTATFAVLLIASSAFSYAYTPFSMMVGENTFAINPFVSVDNDGIYGQDLFFGYGITNKADIWLDINVVPESQTTDASMMLRFDLTGKGAIIALRTNGTYISPQFHWIWENSHIALQANLASQINYNYPDKPAVYGIFSPALKLFGGLADIFCEINPGYYMQDDCFANLYTRPEGFGLDIVSGVGFAIGSTLFSLACPIYNVTNGPKVTFGAWWFFAITPKE